MGARKAILRAARELLDERGLTGITMEGIAARAKVGKPTLYRHWSNRYELAMAALIEAVPPVKPNEKGSPLKQIRAQLQHVASVFTTPAGRNIAAILAASYGETEISKAFRSHFIQAQRNEGRRLLLLAIEAGEIRRKLDLEIALDLVYGPVFYRLTMGHAPLTTAFVDAVWNETLEGLGT